MNLLNLTYCLLLCLGGFIATVYETLAYSFGLNVGTTFRRGGIMVGLGVVAIIFSLIATIIINPWWTVFIVLVSSFVLSQVFIKIFGDFSQLLSIVFLLVGAIFTIINLF